MAAGYVNVNQLLDRFMRHQRHIERFVGFIGVLDVVFDTHQNIDLPLPPSYWQMYVLLLAQRDKTENGIYVIGASGLWERAAIELELGNIVSVNTAQNGGAESYFKVTEISHTGQVWQALHLPKNEISTASGLKLS
ncbi:hypothetical protein [Pseudoalteromonas luteoviolacea]|nr:hypothetical protein [Pseudoalteromonas luteoviolacea]